MEQFQALPVMIYNGRKIFMRRKDRLREETDFIYRVLDEADTIYLAMLDWQYPYCIPLNFARIENRLYIHCAFEGLKLDLIGKNPHVAFATALDVEIDREKSTTYYRSISGNGTAALVDDVAEKCRALEAIGMKYASRCSVPCPPATAGRVAILRIDIATISGKQSSRKSAEKD